MSRFFGIFRPQGGPVDLEAFEQMKTAMHREGFDGMETHVEEEIAVGHLMLRVSPESKYDKQPLKSSCGNYLLVGHFRLDYRDELGDKLGLTQSELEVTPDSQLALLAYQKWKEKCVDHLEGDWAFVVFSPFKICLGLFRDHFGYSALFYIFFKRTLYFSSDISCLLSIKSLDLKLDVEQILRISTNALLLSPGKTLFQHMSNLEHGTFIRVSASLDLRINSYWQLLNGPLTRYKYEVDYSDHLFSLFQRSVATKFNSGLKSGLFLSSGLDSTSVCYFLDKMATFHGVEIHSFTSVLTGLNEFNKTQLKFSDEKPYVEEFIGGTKSVVSHFYNFDKKEIDFLEFSNRDYFYPIATPTSFWIDGIYNEAKNMGIKRMYNGQFGNITISNIYKEYLLNYLFKFKWRSLLREINNYSKKGGIGFFHGLKEHIYMPFSSLLSVAFINRKTRVKNLVKESVFQDHLFKKFGFLPVFENESLDGKRFPQINELSLRRPLFDGVARIATINWYNYSNFYGVETIDPTSDLRLLTYSTSIPPNLFNQNGLSSSLFKATFKSHLPEFLLSLKFRRLQSMDIAIRLRKSSKFERSINELSSDLEIQKGLFKKSSLKTDFKELNSTKSLFNGYGLSRKLLKNISLIQFVKKSTIS